MKLKLIDENNIIVFLNTRKIDIDYNIKSDLEIELKQLFKDLNSIYGLELSGYYNVSIYVDKLYGSIISLAKEDFDYIEYDVDQVDMRIIIYQKEFLYQLHSLYNIDLDCDIYLYGGKYYVKLKESIDKYKLGQLIELSDVIYDSKIDEVLKFGTILKNKDYVL